MEVLGGIQHFLFELGHIDFFGHFLIVSIGESPWFDDWLGRICAVI